MITPAQLDLTVQRHAPFPSIDPWRLRDSLTGAPIDITGATITLQVRLYDGAPGDPLLNETVSVVNGPQGTYGPPSISEAEMEALPTANSSDPRPLTAAVRFRYDIKMEGVTGWPAAVIVQRGYFVVQDGANV
jgi:hypothetical protein